MYQVDIRTDDEKLTFKARVDQNSPSPPILTKVKCYPKIWTLTGSSTKIMSCLARRGSGKTVDGVG